MSVDVSAIDPVRDGIREAIEEAEANAALGERHCENCKALLSEISRLQKRLHQERSDA